MKSSKLLFLLVLLPGLLLAAYSAPQVTGLAASQRRDGSKVMDVSYALSSFENRACKVSLYYSLDGGSTWSLAQAVSGAVGEGVAPGSGKSITWRMGEELSATATGVRVRVTADDGLADLTGTPAPALTVPSDSVVFGADYTISWSAVTGATVYTLRCPGARVLPQWTAVGRLRGHRRVLKIMKIRALHCTTG